MVPSEEFLDTGRDFWIISLSYVERSLLLKRCRFLIVRRYSWWLLLFLQCLKQINDQRLGVAADYRWSALVLLLLRICRVDSLKHRVYTADLVEKFTCVLDRRLILRMRVAGKRLLRLVRGLARIVIVLRCMIHRLMRLSTRCVLVNWI